jgi:hypothetical protein
MAKSQYEYEPLALDEQEESFRSDPVKLGMTDGTEDPINTRTDEEIRQSEG